MLELHRYQDGTSVVAVGTAEAHHQGQMGKGRRERESREAVTL